MSQKAKIIFVISLLVVAAVFIMGSEHSRVLVRISGSEHPPLKRVFSAEEKIRPYPDVISVEEMYDGLIRDAYTRKAHFTKDIVDKMKLAENKKKNNPETVEKDPETEFYSKFNNAKIGQIVLVEDYGSPLQDVAPYFYYVDLVDEDNSILMEGMAYAMAGDEYPGGIGQLSISSADSMPVSTLTGSEAEKLVKTSFKIKDNDCLAIKAVYIPTGSYTPRTEWGWAVKFEKPVTVRGVDNHIYTSQQFWVNRSAYNLEKIQKKFNIEEIKKEIQIAVINFDVFNNDGGTSCNRKNIPSRCKLVPVKLY